MRKAIAREIRSARLAAAIGIFLLSAISASGGEISRDFLEQYQPFAKLGLELYSQATIQGIVDRHLGKHDVLDHSFIYRIDGPLLRLDLGFLESQSSPRFKGRPSQVFIANPEASICAERHSVDEPFVPSEDAENDYESVREQIYNRTSCITPYKVFDEPVIEFLKSSFVTVQSIETVSIDGRKLVEIKAQQRLPGKDPRIVTWDTSLYFLPEQGWVLWKYTENSDAWVASLKDKHTDDKAGTMMSWILDYDGTNDGIPILKRTTYREGRTKKTPWDVRIMNVDNIHFGAPNARDFTTESVDLKN